jgi:hypothetical protein
MSSTLDLLPYATTEAQRAHVQAVAEHGSAAAAAPATGISRGTLTKTISVLRKRAALVGHGEHNPHVPDGFRVKGVSRLIDSDGATKQEWIKTERDKPSPEDVAEAMDRAFADWDGPLAHPVPAPAVTEDDKLTVYPMGDPHVGCLAWAPETGADYDLEIAEHLLTDTARQLVDFAPPSTRALVLNLGDFFHADDPSNRTPTGGNQLDVDGRQAKIIDAGLRIMGTVIELALTKHEVVTLVNVRGNHDPSSSLWLSRAMRERYRNDPRVEVDTSPAWMGHMVFGENLLAWTHGHGAKLPTLPGKMAAAWPKQWGDTTYRKCHVGHFHHKDTKEHDGATVETYNTLAARDAWHAMKGYQADRYAVCEVYHRGKRGPQRIHRVNVETP